MTNLTQIIEAQKKEFEQELDDATYLMRIEHPCCYDHENRTQIIKSHTTSIIQILEAIVGEMEKEKRTVEDIEGNTILSLCHYNEALDTQVNNLTAAISELK